MIKKMMKMRNKHLIEVPSGNTYIDWPVSSIFHKLPEEKQVALLSSCLLLRSLKKSHWISMIHRVISPEKHPPGHVTMWDCLPFRIPTSCCIRSIWSQKMSVSRCPVVLWISYDVRWRSGVYRRCLETLDASKCVTMIQDGILGSTLPREVIRIRR